MVLNLLLKIAFRPYRIRANKSLPIGWSSTVTLRRPSLFFSSHFKSFSSSYSPERGYLAVFIVSEDREQL